MPIKLSYKLFAAFFLILVIVSGAMAFSRYLFFQNLRDYIHQEEMEKLEGLVLVLGEEYRARGSWEGIAADPRRWRSLLRTAPDRTPPQGTSSVDGPGPKKGRRHGRPLDVLLLDAGGEPIIGATGPDAPERLIPIAVDGRTVGFLGLNKREPFKSGPPAALLERQTRQLYLLGGAVIGLTALIAFLFSRHLLGPIQRLTRGTREVANRDFTVRIQATTRDELGQLADNFNAMARTLGDYETMRRQWLTDISHELRTPLAVLRGEIEALQDGIRDPSPENLASLHGEILRLGKLVEDLHLLSLAESDRLFLNRQPISPATLLGMTVNSHALRFAQRRIDVDLSLDGIKGVLISGDADRLGQVFGNILDNACKYVGSPGTLNITGEAGANGLILRFKDSGPGVPDDALPRLFDRLYRVDPSRSRDTGGSGLGLSICRQIIEQHRGSVWAEKNAMGGLTIGIELPRMAL